MGRLTLPLARHFDEAVGVDISPAMLAEAEANAKDKGIDNARFVLSDDQLSKVQGRFDLVHSYIVLQHIPAKRGIRIARRLLEHVAPGGVASLHVSLSPEEGLVQSGTYWVRKNVPGVDQLVRFVRGGYKGPMMQMNSYSLPLILRYFEELGFGQVIIDKEVHGSRLTVHLAAKRVAVPAPS